MDVITPKLDSILAQLQGITRVVEQLATPAALMDPTLDASLDSIRRVLSELVEQRLESVMRELADIRRAAASAPEHGGARLVDRLDELLEHLGAIRFEAEAMDLIDPLIHVVVEERRVAEVPDGAILATLRPGYRTARGTIICKAAVAVNQQA